METDPSTILGPTEVEAFLRRMRDQALSVEYLAITGSHSWGLATEESDVDLRGFFGWPLERALSLYPGRDNYQGMEGDLDYQIYEVAKLMRMLLSANGNVVELLLNPLCCHRTDLGERLAGLGRWFQTRRLSQYYLGYATSQRKRAAQNRGGRALVYTYREMYAGIYLMAEGEIVFDFTRLRALVEPRWYRSDVLAWAMEHRRDPTPLEIMEGFEREWSELEQVFRAACDASPLPEREPEWVGRELERILFEYRCAGLRAAQ